MTERVIVGPVSGELKIFSKGSSMTVFPTGVTSGKGKWR
jgi:hypothetical protein